MKNRLRRDGVYGDTISPCPIQTLSDMVDHNFQGNFHIWWCLPFPVSLLLVANFKILSFFRKINQATHLKFQTDKLAMKYIFGNSKYFSKWMPFVLHQHRNGQFFLLTALTDTGII